MAPPLFPPNYDFGQLSDGVVNDRSSGGSGSFGQSNSALVKLLKKSGVSDVEIARFIATKTPSAAISKILSPGQIQQLSTGVGTHVNTNNQPASPRVSGGSGSIDLPFGQNFLQGNQTRNLALGIANGAAESQGQASGNTSSLGTALSAGLSGLVKSLQIPITGQLGKQPPVTGAANANIADSQASNTAAKQAILNKALHGISNSTGIISKIQAALKAGQGTVGAQPTADPTTSGLDFPTGGAPDMFTPMEIAPRDFSAEANTLAGNAYQPLYDSIALGKTNAQGQYNTSDAVVKGLYDKLVSDTKASGTTQAAQYDQSGAEAAARSQALQDRTGQIYQQSNADISGLLGNIGQGGAAAQQVLGGNAGEQAFQQADAAAQGTAQQNYYGAAKQNSQDQTTGIANAQNTQGVVSREGLVKDLSNVLNQYDQQTLQTKGQQANAAIGIGQNLSSQDLSAQTANAGNQLGAFNANQSAQQAALSAQQQAMQFQYGVGQDQLANARADAGLTGIYNGQPTLDAAAALAKAQTSSTGNTGLDLTQFGAPDGKAGTLPPSGEVAATAETSDPGHGPEYVALFNGIVTGSLIPDFNVDNTNLQQFASMAAEQAKNHGLDPATAFAAAGTYWQKVMNRH